MATIYIDFDGVILDTNDLIDDFRDIVRYKNNLSKDEDVEKYLNNMNWYGILSRARIIENSINHIKQLQNEKLFKIIILTKYNTFTERASKDYIIKKLFNPNGIEIVFVPCYVHKCEVVCPKGNILIDDYIENLIAWHQAGGIAIKFSDGNKISSFPRITNIGEITEKCYKLYPQRIKKSKI
ncbi:MAG: hypothetical protein Q4G04_02980 [bacterium]|nr:hypothetical protein [bacterium]